MDQRLINEKKTGKREIINRRRPRSEIEGEASLEKQKK